MPAYIEYFSVQKALDQTLLDESPNPTIAEIRRVDRPPAVAPTTSTRSAPATSMVGREGNQIVATLSWQKMLHMIGNASILLEFDAYARREADAARPMAAALRASRLGYAFRRARACCARR